MWFLQKIFRLLSPLLTFLEWCEKITRCWTCRTRSTHSVVQSRTTQTFPTLRCWHLRSVWSIACTVEYTMKVEWGNSQVWQWLDDKSRVEEQWLHAISVKYESMVPCSAWMALQVCITLLTHKWHPPLKYTCGKHHMCSVHFACMLSLSLSLQNLWLYSLFQLFADPHLLTIQNTPSDPHTNKWRNQISLLNKALAVTQSPMSELLSYTYIFTIHWNC